jgi:hypothetical protein
MTSDARATERVLGRRVRCSYNSAGFGASATGTPYFQGAPVALALIWELIDRSPLDELSPTVRKIIHFRSIRLCVFSGQRRL